MSAQRWCRVYGTITGPDGYPIIGASVVEKGTTNGTVVDYDGYYSLNMNVPGTLCISFIGLKTIEVHIAKCGRHDFTMEDDSELLEDEVVVPLSKETDEQKE